MPSHGRGLRALRNLAPELITLMIASAAAIRTSDPDLWGHVRFGQVMLNRRHLVLYDPYSYSALGHLWRNHEWLTEIVMALFYNHLGGTGLKLWKLACSGATLGLLVLAMAETGAARRLQLVILIITAVAITPFIQFRPQLFSFVLFTALIALLARRTYREATPLWMVIPLMALWANLHGGFIVGIAALWIYAAVVCCRNAIAARQMGGAGRLVMLAAAGTLATVLTPYGGGLWIAVGHALSNPLTRAIIDDWKTPFAFIRSGGKTNYLYAFFCLYAWGLVGLLGIALYLTPSLDDLPLVAVAAIMSVGSFIAVRNLAFAALACSVPVAHHLALSERGGQPRIDGVVLSLRMRWGITAIALMVALFRGGLASGLIPVDESYPSGPVQFMKANGLHGNVLCNFGWGEYLIWHLAPQSRVFIDGRYDTVYPSKVIQDYVKVHFGIPGAKRVLKSYPHDFILFPAQSVPSLSLKASPDWKLVYKDNAAALFARRNSAAARLHPIAENARPAAAYFP